MSDLGFTSVATKRGAILISRHGKLVTTVRGKQAALFLKRVTGADSAEIQQQLARITGNYKRGNERIAKSRHA